MPEKPEWVQNALVGGVGAMLAISSLALISRAPTEKVRERPAIEQEQNPRLNQHLGVVAVAAETLPQPPETTTTVLPPPTTTLPPKPSPAIAGNCEQYRHLVAQYDWPVEAAMLTMRVESGCDPNKISATNDHGLMQLNKIPVYDPAENIRIAYNQKYVTARRGSRNFSAWFAVCTFSDNPQPKYPSVNCQ